VRSEQIRRASAAPTSTARATPEPASEIDRFGNPILGKPHIETSSDGTVVSGAELASGYNDALPIAAVTDLGPPENAVRTHPDEPPPGHSKLDPAQYGYRSMTDMERDVRRGLHVPDGYGVTLWAQERDGRQGVAIQIVPPHELARAWRR
jgi:hypothetical protein